ncbi:anti-sigma factor antagonist [Metabacillus fastidiosus]|uniref:Anti-sigma factor antagonist n=1 Tax=Metabacillus fastidiosus TaxID=1458 RepID=A0ABU6NTW4_9BACI|nr:anti-sigma factor antagonist [Metabacillus fastidiosus]MED4400583.1 anti-sigma factor antagonist [Metabacillus fastidiosus]MED4455808.1 anti-sigma factor antagonist [Metabacillus fastidiosus]MED4464522.1 anti-sigma factor antagonist [Metabacillus fastidiosus]MED4534355.1 anti-sigma factor antagonist [Metabacillus fastidiosus]
MDIKIDKNFNNETAIVLVSGEIDAFTAPKLKEELLPLTEEQKMTLIVSLEDVSYIDSTGLGVFVGLFKQIKKNDGELKLVNLSERLRRLFEITGLNNIIDISSESEVGDNETIG